MYSQDARAWVPPGHVSSVVLHSYHYRSSGFLYVRLTRKTVLVTALTSKTRSVECIRALNVIQKLAIIGYKSEFLEGQDFPS